MDQNLVICNAKIRFRVDKKSENKSKVDVNKLQQPTTKAIFELAIKNHLEQLSKLPKGLDEALESINKNITVIALNVILKRNLIKKE